MGAAGKRARIFLRRNLKPAGEPYEKTGCESRQAEVSRQVTGLIDVLYGLVLVQGAVSYRAIFVEPGEFLHPPRFLPVVAALVLVYFIAVQSYVDFHLAAEGQPYRFLNKGKRRMDLWRFYLDILIVGLYSFLLLKCHPLIGSPDADLRPVFIAIPVIFVLYLLWGALRSGCSPFHGFATAQRYSPLLLFVFLVAFVFLAGVYLLLPATWQVNAAFLSAALAIMAGYRWLNWNQNRYCP